MRTTVPLDNDVENLLRVAMREGLRGAPLHKVAYRLMTFDVGKPLVGLTKAPSLAQDLEDQETLHKHRHQA